MGLCDLPGGATEDPTERELSSSGESRCWGQKAAFIVSPEVSEEEVRKEIHVSDDCGFPCVPLAESN